MMAKTYWAKDEKPSTREPAMTSIGRGMDRLGTISRIVLAVIIWGALAWLWLLAALP